MIKVDSAGPRLERLYAAVCADLKINPLVDLPRIARIVTNADWLIFVHIRGIRGRNVAAITNRSADCDAHLPQWAVEKRNYQPETFFWTPIQIFSNVRRQFFRQRSVHDANRDSTSINRQKMKSKIRWQELLLPVAILGCLFVIFVPLPPGLLDLLLAANITAAVVILLTTLFVRTPLELSLFPSLLLGTTLARLALNISTTRLILTDGAAVGELAAGGVIRSFGQAVGGDNIAVGLIIFSIIVIIQFVVITKGSSRISEVSARFALDGLPGRQMAIDADLNSGVIDSNEARQLRGDLTAQADFYGAMDGASKFVRGDAIAGILITVINIAGGLVIGLLAGMNLTAAAGIFTKLTIGDGLVSQIPALLIALAAGLLVSRSTKDVNLAEESIDQIFSRPPVMWITAGFLCVLIFTGLPVLPLLVLSGICVAIALMPRQQNGMGIERNAESKSATRPAEVTIDKLLSNDVVEMELGADLIRLADPRSGGNLLNAITIVRKELAAELGIILPKIRVRDNLRLGENEYRILLQGNPVDQSEVHPECYLAVDTGHASAPVDRDQVRGIFMNSRHREPAYWVSQDSCDAVSHSGYMVMSATDVLADQLKQLSVKFASDLLTRDATRQLIDETRKSSPAVVDELIPEIMNLADVQRILKALLSEGVSIRPLGLILETLGDHAVEKKQTGIRTVESNLNSRIRPKSHWDLIECVRQRLAPHIIARISRPGQPLSVFTLSEDLQHRIACGWERERDEIKIGLSHSIVEGIASAIDQAARKMTASGQQPVALVEQSIRPVIRELAVGASREMMVIGDKELGNAQVQIIGEVTIEDVRAVEKAA